MKNIEPKKDFDRQLTPSDVSTSELNSEDELTEQQKAIAWSEFEYEMYLLTKEDNN